jgi:Lipocalin-like domain
LAPLLLTAAATAALAGENPLLGT